MAALAALRLDDSLAEAHTSLAFVEMHYQWDCAAAEFTYEFTVCRGDESFCGDRNGEDSLAGLREAAEPHTLGEASRAEATIISFRHETDRGLITNSRKFTLRHSMVPQAEAKLENACHRLGN